MKKLVSVCYFSDSPNFYHVRVLKASLTRTRFLWRAGAWEGREYSCTSSSPPTPSYCSSHCTPASPGSSLEFLFHFHPLCSLRLTHQTLEYFAIVLGNSGHVWGNLYLLQGDSVWAKECGKISFTSYILILSKPQLNHNWTKPNQTTNKATKLGFTRLLVCTTSDIPVECQAVYRNERPLARRELNGPWEHVQVFIWCKSAIGDGQQQRSV